MLKIKAKPESFDKKKREMIMNLVRLRQDANTYILRVAAQMSIRTGLSEKYCDEIVRRDLAKQRAKMIEDADDARAEKKIIEALKAVDGVKKKLQELLK